LKENKKILTVLTHLVAWICLFSVPYLVFFPRLREFNMSDHMMATIIIKYVFIIFFYYLNTQFLVPKLLINRKWWLYFLSVVVTLSIYLFTPKQVATIFATPEYIEQNGNYVVNPAFKGDKKMTRTPRRSRRLADPYNTVLFLLVLSFGTCISVTQQWFSSDQTKKETENEKLNTELSFLKSQINPHFFFNTLNNIYSLAIIKSEQTAPAVMKLSSIMRYILSETQKDFVPLSNEIEFTKNYIELQQMRLTDKVKLAFNVSGVTGDLHIAPLLFIPFVENAFKYGVSTKEHTSIDIQITATQQQIEFQARNTVATNISTHLDSTGIGINNAKRRLELLYPGRYQLNISTEHNTYQVSLKINS
jgi:hypothetical protein